MKWREIVHSKWGEMLPRVPSVRTDVWELPIFCIDEHYIMHLTNKFDKILNEEDGSITVQHEFEHIQPTSKPHTWRRLMTQVALLMKEKGCGRDVAMFIHNTYSDSFNNLFRNFNSNGQQFVDTFTKWQTQMGGKLEGKDEKDKTVKIDNKYMKVFLKVHELGVEQEIFGIKDDDVEKKAEKLLKLLQDNSRGIASDMEVLRYLYSLYEQEAERLKQMIKDGKLKPMPGGSGGFPIEMDDYGALGPNTEEKGDGQPKDEDERLKRLAKIASETGLDKGDGKGLEKLCKSKQAGSKVGNLTSKDLKEYALNAKVLNYIEKAIKIFDARERVIKRGLKVDMHKQWRIGDDVDALDIEETLRRNGHVIPEVTTMGRSGFDIPKHTFTGLGSSAIVSLADMSGSVSGYLDRICEVNACLAKTAWDKGIPMTTGQFSSDWSLFGDLSYEYFSLIKWCFTQHISSNSTIIGTLLREIDKKVGNLKNVTFIIITDSYIWDIHQKEVVSLLQKFVSNGCVFRIFLIDTEGFGREMTQAIKAVGSDSFKAFTVPKEGDLTNMILDETEICN